MIRLETKKNPRRKKKGEVRGHHPLPRFTISSKEGNWEKKVCLGDPGSVVMQRKGGKEGKIWPHIKREWPRKGRKSTREVSDFMAGSRARGERKCMC